MRTDQEVHYVVDGFLRILREREAETARLHASVAKTKSLSVGVIHDKEAEAALLMSVWVNNNQAMLERLDSQDFGDPLNAFIFREWRMMSEAGVPLSDAVAMRRWFANGAACQRFNREVGKSAEPLTEVMIRFTEFNKRYVTATHDEYYYRCLRVERIRRTFAAMSRLLWKTNAHNNDSPWDTLKWLSEQVDKAWVLCHEVFDKEMDQ